MTLPADRWRHPSSGNADEVAARDQAWVERIRIGDVQAFEAMYRAYRKDLGAFAASHVRSVHAAEDLIHDLFLRLWQNRHEWELTIPLNVYLFRAARYRAISHLRHARVAAKFRERIAVEGASAAFGAGPPAPADAALHEGELEAAINRAIDALPERRREVFRLNRYHHLTYAEVAEVLGISVKTVEIHMGLALRALREQLAAWHESLL